MDTFMKADIFFFITTIAVVIFAILGVIICVYLIQILKNIKRASDRLEQSIESTFDHADALSQTIKESFLFNLLFGRKAKRQTKQKSE